MGHIICTRIKINRGKNVFLEDFDSSFLHALFLALEKSV